MEPVIRAQENQTKVKSVQGWHADGQGIALARWRQLAIPACADCSQPEITMIPIQFAGANVVYAKDQPEYLPLPAHKSDNGTVTSCWNLTLKERLKVLLRGRVFISMLTFNHPLQPILPSTDFKP